MDALRLFTKSLAVSIVGLAFSPWNMVYGQPLRSNMPNRANPSLMTPSRELLSLLDEAKANVEAKEWTEATLAIGTLLGLEDAELNEDIGVDYFLRPGKSKLRIIKGSLFAEIADITNELPEEAFEILNVRHGVQAEQALRKALEEGDWRALEGVATRYSFLASGQDATLLLAERAMHQGDLLKAAMLYVKLFEQKRPFARFGPSVALAAASAFLEAGSPEEANTILTELAQKTPSGKVNWHGKNVQWNNGAIDLAAVSDLLASNKVTSVQRSVTRPLLSGGNAQRNSSTSAGVPLPMLRWHAELHESSQHRQNLLSSLKSQSSLPRDAAAALIPSRVPICIGRSIVVSTYDQRIVAIDSLNGLLQWVQPYSGMPLGLAMDGMATRLSLARDDETPDYLSKRVWGEAATGNLASDGIRIYGVSELPSIDVAESFALGPNARMSKPLAAKTYNVLQCWSAPGEGKLLWEVGGVKSEREPELINALFLGPPLPHRGELLIMAEINSEVLLLSLTPETGKLRWKQPLVSNATGTIASDVLRRNVGASPSVDGNIVFCPTLSGYLVAFDLHSRSLQWAYPYEMRESTSFSQVGPFGSEQMGDYSPFEARSADLSPVVSDGVAVFSPTEGSGVFAVSIQSGKPLWYELKERAYQVRYVGGIVSDTVIVVCQSSVYGLDLMSGKERWQIPLGPGQQVVGKGVRNGTKYYLPTAEPSILELDLDSGKMLDFIRLEHVPGNLIYANDKLISVSPLQMDAYAIRDLVRNEVRVELENSSVSTQSMLKRGELALAEGKIDDAMDLLEKVYVSDPTNQECWGLLRKASTMALGSDFEKYASRIAKFDIGLENDFVFLRMLVFGLQQKGQYEDVLLKLFEFSDARTGRRREQTASSDYFTPTEELTIQEDRWIETQLTQLFERLPNLEANPKLKAGLDSQIKKLEALPPNLQRIKLKHFRAHPAVRNSRNKLADELLNDGKLMDAEELLVESLGTRPFREFMAIDRDAAILLAKVYQVANRPHLVDTLLGDDTEGRNVLNSWFSQWVDSDPDRRSLEIASVSEQNTTEWPKGKVNVTIATASENFGMDNAIACRMKSCVGETLLGWEITSSANDNLITLRNTKSRLSTTLRLPSLDLGVPVNEAFAIDGKLILDSNRTIIAVDTLLPPFEFQQELWHRYFEPATQEIVPGRGRPKEAVYWGIPLPNKTFRVVHADRTGILVINDDQLISLDPKSRNTLWSHSGFSGGSFSVRGNSLFAVLPNKKLVQLDLLSGLQVDAKEFDGGSSVCFSTGEYFLFADEISRTIRLVDPVQGKVVLERVLPRDAQIGLLPNVCVVAFDGSGKLIYWNLETAKEFDHQVKLEDTEFGELTSEDIREKRLSLQLFRDKLLLLPYSSAYRYSMTVTPTESERGFVLVSGSVFAVSIEDGAPLWERSVPVKDFRFPLHQDREQSPAAFFVRRILLPNANDKKVGEMACIAAIDLRTGKVLYENNDTPGIKQAKTFHQQIDPSGKKIQCTYSGILFDFAWDTNQSTKEDGVNAVGFLEEADYKERVKQLFKKLNEEREKAGRLPSKGLPTLPPQP